MIARRRVILPLLLLPYRRISNVLFSHHRFGISSFSVKARDDAASAAAATTAVTNQGAVANEAIASPGHSSSSSSSSEGGEKRVPPLNPNRFSARVFDLIVEYPKLFFGSIAAAIATWLFYSYLGNKRQEALIKRLESENILSPREVGFLSMTNAVPLHVFAAFAGMFLCPEDTGSSRDRGSSLQQRYPFNPENAGNTDSGGISPAVDAASLLLRQLLVLEQLIGDVNKALEAAPVPATTTAVQAIFGTDGASSSAGGKDGGAPATPVSASIKERTLEILRDLLMRQASFDASRAVTAEGAGNTSAGSFSADLCFSSPALAEMAALEALKRWSEEGGGGLKMRDTRGESNDKSLDADALQSHLHAALVKKLFPGAHSKDSLLFLSSCLGIAAASTTEQTWVGLAQAFGSTIHTLDQYSSLGPYGLSVLMALTLSLALYSSEDTARQSKVMDRLSTMSFQSQQPAFPPSLRREHNLRRAAAVLTARQLLQADAAAEERAAESMGDGTTTATTMTTAMTTTGSKSETTPAGPAVWSGTTTKLLSQEEIDEALGKGQYSASDAAAFQDDAELRKELGRYVGRGTVLEPHLVPSAKASTSVPGFKLELPRSPIHPSDIAASIAAERRRLLARAQKEEGNAEEAGSGKKVDTAAIPEDVGLDTLTVLGLFASTIAARSEPPRPPTLEELRRETRPWWDVLIPRYFEDAVYGPPDDEALAKMSATNPRYRTLYDGRATPSQRLRLYLQLVKTYREKRGASSKNGTVAIRDEKTQDVATADAEKDLESEMMRMLEKKTDSEHEGAVVAAASALPASLLPPQVALISDWLDLSNEAIAARKGEQSSVIKKNTAGASSAASSSSPLFLNHLSQLVSAPKNGTIASSPIMQGAGPTSPSGKSVVEDPSVHSETLYSVEEVCDTIALLLLSHQISPKYRTYLIEKPSYSFDLPQSRVMSPERHLMEAMKDTKIDAVTAPIPPLPAVGDGSSASAPPSSSSSLGANASRAQTPPSWRRTRRGLQPPDELELAAIENMKNSPQRRGLFTEREVLRLIFSRSICAWGECTHYDPAPSLWFTNLTPPPPTPPTS